MPSQWENIKSFSKRLILSVLGAGCILHSNQSLAADVDAKVGVIAGRSIESFVIKNQDADVCIVFENGLRATISSWSKVIEALPSNVSVFAYNRPGYGQSQKAETLRDGTTITEELKGALMQKGLLPPYILVGHSLGGLYMQLFAKRYAEEVGGLVLVDSLYPTMVKKPEDFPWLARSAKRLFFSSTVNNEIDLIYKTGEEVLALPGINAKPIVLLFNKPKANTAVPVDFGAFNQDPETVEFVRNMYPNAKRITSDSDHQMQLQSPQEVVDAIRFVVATYRNADGLKSEGSK